MLKTFINQSEKAAFADNAARTEIVRNGEDETIIYEGTPSESDPALADASPWTIARTVVTEKGDETRIETRWAEGLWENRKELTYKYI